MAVHALLFSLPTVRHVRCRLRLARRIMSEIIILEVWWGTLCCVVIRWGREGGRRGREEGGEGEKNQLI